MTQAYVGMSKMDLKKELMGDNAEINRRKATIKLSDNSQVSVFQNDDNNAAIVIRKGTGSVSISKESFSEICDLRDTIFLFLLFTLYSEIHLYSICNMK